MYIKAVARFYSVWGFHWSASDCWLYPDVLKPDIVFSLLFNKGRKSQRIVPKTKCLTLSLCRGAGWTCQIKGELSGLCLTTFDDTKKGSRVHPHWFFRCTPWWTFPSCLIRPLLKELFQGLKGLIKKLCWWSCPDGSLTRGPSPALMQIYAMRTLGSGRTPSQITQSEFSRKLNSFWWLIRLFSFSLRL